VIRAARSWSIGVGLVDNRILVDGDGVCRVCAVSWSAMWARKRSASETSGGAHSSRVVRAASANCLSCLLLLRMNPVSSAQESRRIALSWVLGAGWDASGLQRNANASTFRLELLFLSTRETMTAGTLLKDDGGEFMEHSVVATLNPASSISWSRVYPRLLKNCSSTLVASACVRNFVVLFFCGRQ